MRLTNNNLRLENKAMASEDFHRDSCQRLHRIVANYLAHQAWLRQLDCIVLIRADLTHFLQLARFKSTRIEWLLADMKPWFPYQVPYYKTGSSSSIHSLFLSRDPIAKHLPSGSMTTAARISRMADYAPRTEMYFKSGTVRPAESEIIGDLALLSTGLSVPTVAKARRKRKTK
jgi:hypothetical protein